MNESKRIYDANCKLDDSVRASSFAEPLLTGHLHSKNHYITDFKFDFNMLKPVPQY